MKRKDKEIIDITTIESIINKAKVCRLGMTYENKPYVIPLNFGYKDQTLYFHCANEGHKLDILRMNPSVCFEIDERHTMVEGDMACDYTMKFESVIGYGEVELITEDEKKIDCLDILMGQYTKKPGFTYSEKALKAVTIIKLPIKTMTGKSSYL